MKKNYVLDFNDYVVTEATKTFQEYQSKNYKVAIVESLIKSGTLELETQFILETASQKGLYDELWEGSFNEDFINENINEGRFKDWFVDKYEKAVDVIQDVKKKGGEALSAAKKEVVNKAQQTAQFFKSIGDYLGKILEAIKDGLKKLWKFIYDGVKKKYAGKEGDMVNNASQMMAKKPEQSTQEIDHLKEINLAGYVFVTSGAAKLYFKGIKDAANKDSEEIPDKQNEEYQQFVGFYDVALHEGIYLCIEKYGMNFINEIQSEEVILEGGDTIKIPGISKLMDVLRELPIIKQLGDIEHFAAKAANNGLGRLSAFFNKMGLTGGPYKFVIIGGLIGLGVELAAKTALKAGIHLVEDDKEKYDSFGSIEEGGGGEKEKTLKDYMIAAGISTGILLICLLVPGFGVIFKLMKTVAEAVWYYSLFQACAALIKQYIDKKKKKGGDVEWDVDKDAAEKMYAEQEKENEERLKDKAEEDSKEDKPEEEKDKK